MTDARVARKAAYIHRSRQLPACLQKDRHTSRTESSLPLFATTFVDIDIDIDIHIGIDMDIAVDIGTGIDIYSDIGFYLDLVVHPV